MTEMTDEITKRADICRSEYAKNGEFKEYMDRFMRKEYEKSLDDVFKELIIYDICMYYKQKIDKK